MKKFLYDVNQDTVLCKEYPFREYEIVADSSIFRYPSLLDVSIIIPCYNVERFLTSCIESLAAQKTQYSFEAIFVNDGSTDGTKEILDQAKKKYPIFQCIHQPNQGCGAARNTGMRKAKGEYLLFVDADDVVSDNYVEALVGCVKASGADLGACAYYSFTENGLRYKEVQWPKNVKTSEITGTSWGKIFRRTLFDRLLWPSGRYQDTILSYLVFPKVNQLVTTNDCTYGYRSSLQNTTNAGRKSAKALDTLYITAQVLRCMEKLKLEDWLYTLEGHDLLVNQFYLNQCRIQQLSENIQKEVFRLQCEYYREMDQHAAGKHRYDSRLYALALRKNSMVLGNCAVKLEKANKALRIVSSRLSRLLRRGETQ